MSAVEFAEREGLSCRDMIALGQSDRRIFMPPFLQEEGSRVRLKRWLAAGSPEPDLTRLQYRGSDWARTVVLGVPRRMPKPVAWHICEHVIVREVGSRSAGWICGAMTPRHPDGDHAHEIVLCGQTDEESLASVFAHECGHSWSKTVSPFPAASTVNMSDRELTARTVLVFREAGVTVEQLVNERVADERLADQLATLFGYPRFTDVDGLRRMFMAAHADAAELADQIGEDLDAKQDIKGAA